MYVVLTLADWISRTLDAMSGSVMRLICPFLTAVGLLQVILTVSSLQGKHESNYGDPANNPRL